MKPRPELDRLIDELADVQGAINTITRTLHDLDARRQELLRLIDQEKGKHA